MARLPVQPRSEGWPPGSMVRLGWMELAGRRRGVGRNEQVGNRFVRGSRGADHTGRGRMWNGRRRLEYAEPELPGRSGRQVALFGGAQYRAAEDRGRLDDQ